MHVTPSLVARTRQPSEIAPSQRVRSGELLAATTSMMRIAVKALRLMIITSGRLLIVTGAQPELELYKDRFGRGLLALARAAEDERGRLPAECNRNKTKHTQHYISMLHLTNVQVSPSQV